MEDTGNMVEFAGIGEVAETTTHLLALNLQAAGRRRAAADPVQHLVLQQARDYLNEVRDGFVLSVRSHQVGSLSEIGYLLDRVLIDWDAFSRELGLDAEGDSSGVTADRPASDRDGGNKDAGALNDSGLEKVRHQMLAFAMAAVALGFLPRLPSKEITFPHSYGSPPTYSDIPVPGTPGEMLSRIEEMQGMLWRMMSEDMAHLIQRRYGSVRRTYGFFEASAWLTKKDAERFGIKRSRTAFSWF